jgi:hypothetical protein
VFGHYQPKHEELPEGALFFQKPYLHSVIISAMQAMAA